MTRWAAPGAAFRAGRLVLLVVSMFVLSACSAGGSSPLASGDLGRQVVPPDTMTFSVSNGTTLPVTLVVNGSVVRTLAPDSEADAIPASAPSDLPWAIEVHSPGGRVLTSLTIHAGDVWQENFSNGDSEGKGDGVRVGLSCGMIQIWSGFPLAGPPPGTGSPGDCAP